MEIHKETKNETLTWPKCPLPGYAPKRDKTAPHKDSLCSLQHDSQQLMYGNDLDDINRWMNKESGMWFYFDKGTLPFVTCMDLKDIRLSEINQTQGGTQVVDDVIMSSVCGLKKKQPKTKSTKMEWNSGIREWGMGRKWGWEDVQLKGQKTAKETIHKMRYEMFKISKLSG